MTQRVLGPTGGRRRKRLALLVPFLALAALILAIGASAGTSDDADFEGADGNLVVNTAGNVDWNSFYADDGATPPVRTSPTWVGTAPFRTGSATSGDWTFTGIEDAVAPTQKGESVFGGGVKQDNECPAVNNNPDPPNKDDLKRIYIANATVGGHVYLALAWARVPQNSTSSSAHVAFEFNQNDPDVAGNLCPAGSDSLVKRSTANGGDMLVVYDFEGGSAPALIKLLRWRQSGICEASGKAATPSGCWVLSAFTDWEAKVNTEDALDRIAPNGDDTLHTQEFGEAILDLTDAGVFPASPTACISFGRAFGVSRSSGNSGLAQMKDLVGPADVNITNCGTVIVRKQTSPDEDPNSTNFGFTTTVATLPATTTSPFTLKDDGVNTISNVAPGSYNVIEDNPSPAYLLTDIDCSASNTDVTPTESEATRTASFTIAPGETVDCTFTNTKQKQESSLSTAPWIYPNDKATIAQNDATGSVTFKLYGGATAPAALTNCQANGATGLLYSETVSLPVANPNTVNTSNPGTTGSPNSLKIEATATVYWRVQYSGDSKYLGRLSNCTENIAATLTGDNSGGTNVPDPS